MSCISCGKIGPPWFLRSYSENSYTMLCIYLLVPPPLIVTVDGFQLSAESGLDSTQDDCPGQVFQPSGLLATLCSPPIENTFLANSDHCYTLYFPRSRSTTASSRKTIKVFKCKPSCFPSESLPLRTSSLALTQLRVLRGSISLSVSSPKGRCQVFPSPHSVAMFIPGVGDALLNCTGSCGQHLQSPTGKCCEQLYPAQNANGAYSHL